MRGVDHDPVGLSGLARQCGKDPVEHTQAAPADEPVVDGLVRTVTLGCIAPHLAMLDDVNDRRHNPPVVDSGYPVRQRKKGSIRRICASLSKNGASIGSASSTLPLNQPITPFTSI